MNLLAVALTVSLLLNMLLIMVLIFIPIVRKFLSLIRHTIIAMGPEGVDIRQKRIKGDNYVHKRPDGVEGDVVIDSRLIEPKSDGGRVLFIDTRTLHQVSPTTERDPEKMQQFVQLAGFDGECKNDGDVTELDTGRTDDEGNKIIKRFGWPVWQRVTGAFLLRRRLDRRYKAMEDNEGLWETLAKIAIPIMALFMLMILILGFITLATVKATQGA